MNILVTGGAGFIGSHTCVELLESGYGVVVVDNLCNSNPKSLDRVKELTGKTFKFYEGDVRDEHFTVQTKDVAIAAILPGDANCSGKVTAADAAMILRSLVGLSTLSAEGVLNAEVTGDGAIDAEDAAAILRYVVKLIPALPDA